MITAEELRKILHYDAQTGVFTWMSDRGTNKLKGQRAGGPHNCGYIAMRINNKSYLAHRLAWLYVHGKWPKYEIDHIDGNRSNNRLCNLREATKAENMRNKGKHPANTSGYKGVNWSKAAQKWEAKVQHDKKRYYLGLFLTKEEAAQAVIRKREELHSSFARHV